MPKSIPLATLEVAAPPGNIGKTVIATLKSQGCIIAQGESSISQYDEARIMLHSVHATAQRGCEDYEVWITLNSGDHKSWHPGFGDRYIQDIWHFQQGPWKRITDLALWQERRLSKPENLLRIHYHRFGGYAEGIGLWTWNDNSSLPPVEVFEAARDEFGLVFELDKADYGEVDDNLRLGMLPRIAGDWNQKEDENKFWDSSLGNEIYLIGTVHHIWKEKPDTHQKLLAAFIDAAYCVVIELSRPVDPGEINNIAVHIYDDRHQAIKISHIIHGDTPSNIVKIRTADKLNAGQQAYTVQLDGFHGVVQPALRDILDDVDLFYVASAVLGASYSPEQTVFRVFAPTASAVYAVLYEQPLGNRHIDGEIALYKTEKGVFEGVFKGDWQGKFYRYRLEGPGFSADHQVLDPYCVNAVANGQYARITNLAATNPSDWEKYRHGPSVESPLDMVIYEIHVRDFSIADNSGICNKGKYLGFTEADTRLSGDSDIKTGLDHLQELGVTHVQLLPVQSFNKSEGDYSYNWGYMTVAFNSPESWYATQPDGDSKIREFKQLVAALHVRNIGVIMDVVYNHTDHSSPFSLINAKYYFRFFPNGTYANGSGVGNDFRSEAPMVRKYIIDSLKFWVSEYGVDGFRFDLMALLDIDTLREIEHELRLLKPDIILYGEPWSCGYSPMKGRPTDKQAIRGTGIGAFNDHFRNALGGSPNGIEWGFLQNGSRRDALILGLEGSYRDWADSPAQTINYMTCHDNLVLYDKLRWFNPAASEQDIKDAMKLGYLLLFTAQGVPFLHAGEEFARTKFGHGNSYSAGDEVNQVDWSLKADNYGLFAYVRDIIRLRKSHPLFRLRTAQEIHERVKFWPAPTEKSLIYWIDGAGVIGEEWQEACVLVNGDDSTEIVFSLPPGRWSLAFDLEGLAEESVVFEQCLAVRRKSGLILCRVQEVSEEVAEVETQPDEVLDLP